MLPYPEVSESLLARLREDFPLPRVTPDSSWEAALFAAGAQKVIEKLQHHYNIQNGLEDPE